MMSFDLYFCTSLPLHTHANNRLQYWTLDTKYQIQFSVGKGKIEHGGHLGFNQFGWKTDRSVFKFAVEKIVLNNYCCFVRILRSLCKSRHSKNKRENLRYLYHLETRNH